MSKRDEPAGDWAGPEAREPDWREQELRSALGRVEEDARRREACAPQLAALLECNKRASAFNPMACSRLFSEIERCRQEFDQRHAPPSRRQPSRQQLSDTLASLREEVEMTVERMRWNFEDSVEGLRQWWDRRQQAGRGGGEGSGGGGSARGGEASGGGAGKGGT